MDFASEEDMQKALELNGKKVMGQELKLDMPRSKDSAQEGKKGKIHRIVYLKKNLHKKLNKLNLDISRQPTESVYKILRIEKRFAPSLILMSICPTERDARTLFVKNLPFSATADDLKEVFEDAVDVRLPQGQNGSNRG